MTLRCRVAPLLFGALLAGLMLNSPAHAQNLSAGGLHPVAPPPDQATRTAPAPPALPGARSTPAEVAPPERPPNDMPPTEALFDAINRGDLPAARDALNRGADLHGHSVLGLTPLELSVDLGRNDISFLLLSMRGGGPGEGSGPPPATVAAAPAPPPSRGRRAPAPTPVAQVRPPPAPARPQLFAGNGGAPVPQAGFLGFDAGRPGTP